MAATNWRKVFEELTDIEEPKRIVEQYEFCIGGVGPIPIVVYETMDKEFVATTPGWVRCTTTGTGMGANEHCQRLVVSAANAKAALEDLVARIPAIKGATWKPAAQGN